MNDSYNGKALMTFHHDAHNSHVQDINFHEFLTHAVIVNLYACKSHTAFIEKSIHLLPSNT